MLGAIYFRSWQEIPSGALDLDTFKNARRSETSFSVQSKSARKVKFKPTEGVIGVCNLLKHE